jgi:hypothetical protein
MGEITDPVLRPLSIGEIFDRAITLLVRNWLVLLSIAAVQIIPALFMSYAGTTMNNTSWIGLGSIWGVVAGTVTTVATGVIVAAVYRGGTPVLGSALLIGLKRLPAALGAQFIIALVVGIPLGLVALLAFGMGAFRTANILSDSMAFVVIVAGALWFLCFSVGSLYALTSMGIDDCGIGESVGKAMRLFNGGLGRTLVFGIALTVIAFGGSLVGSSIEVAIRTYFHNAPLGYSVDGVIIFVAEPLADVLIAVFYFDVAIRREGYDMQVALDAMPS